MCWGLNTDGQLGIGNTSDMFSPTTVDFSEGTCRPSWSNRLFLEFVSQVQVVFEAS
jgi:hypothetical protein